MAGHFVGHWKTPVARTPPLGGPGSPQNGKKNSAAGLGGNDVFKVVFWGGGSGNIGPGGTPTLEVDVSTFHLPDLFPTRSSRKGFFLKWDRFPGGGSGMKSRRNVRAGRQPPGALCWSPAGLLGWGHTAAFF